MLTKKDKVEISEIVDKRINQLSDEVVELFTTSTQKLSEQIGDLSSKLDEGLAKLDEHMVISSRRMSKSNPNFNCTTTTPF